MKSYRENPDGEANQKAERETKVAVEMAQRKKFCLKCGATHYSEICPYCDSDAQEEL
jgi:recombinational DNA repair protein RecR